MVVLHEKELTWAERVSWKHHTCMISAFSISTTLKQPTLIWSIANLPHDTYKLLSVASPIGGVLVISTNTIHYRSESAACALALNNYAAPLDSSQELPRASFNTELDAANAAWLLNDVALLSSKTGELLLLTLVYDGRVVRRLDLSKSKASLLTSVRDIEGDGPSAKRPRRSHSDALRDMVGGDELLLYGSAANNTESMQKSFSFAVRDSLVNIGPLKEKPLSFSDALCLDCTNHGAVIFPEMQVEDHSSL